VHTQVTSGMRQPKPDARAGQRGCRDRGLFTSPMARCRREPTSRRQHGVLGGTSAARSARARSPSGDGHGGCYLARYLVACGGTWRVMQQRVRACWESRGLLVARAVFLRSGMRSATVRRSWHAPSRVDGLGGRWWLCNTLPVTTYLLRGLGLGFSGGWQRAAYCTCRRCVLGGWRCRSESKGLAGASVTLYPWVLRAWVAGAGLLARRPGGPAPGLRALAFWDRRSGGPAPCRLWAWSWPCLARDPLGFWVALARPPSSWSSGSALCGGRPPGASAYVLARLPWSRGRLGGGTNQ
jgi:hypothetical protein